MRSQRIAWAVLIGTPTALELWAVHTGRTPWTLSPQLRWALRCHTRAGQYATSLVIGGGSAILAHHLRTLPPVTD